ncbi:MAG TPA: methyltransferase domain-containing protein, partial [Chloroflexota bacterium]|nr:methyltransferase domain-containing protein [Chloroflexota bacterium]
LDKIRFHAGDFHDLSMFADASLDFVVVDAALHHTDDVPRVLGQVHRVLAPNGLFLAVNEPGIAPLRLTRAQSPERFGEHERQHGIIENTFTEQEWRRFFESAGFHVRFVPLHHRRQSLKQKVIHYTPLHWLNGVLFWSKVIVAEKC